MIDLDLVNRQNEKRKTIKLPSSAKEVNWKVGESFQAIVSLANIKRVTSKDNIETERTYLKAIIDATEAFIKSFNPDFKIESFFEFEKEKKDFDLRDMIDNNEDAHYYVYDYFLADDSVFDYIKSLLEDYESAIEIEEDSIKFTVKDEQFFIPLSFIDNVFRGKRRANISMLEATEALEINEYIKRFDTSELFQKTIALCAQKEGQSFSIASASFQKLDNKEELIEKKLEELESIDFATLQSIRDYLKLVTKPKFYRNGKVINSN